jgi:hypothetical protein
MWILHLLLVGITSARIAGVHLALGPEPNSMIVSWETDNPEASYIRINGLQSESPSEGEIVRSCSYLEPDYQLHAILRDLQQGREYEYTIFELDEPAFTKSFRAPGNPDVVTALLFADLGAREESEATLERIKNLTGEISPDVLIHAGDISYADDAFLHEGAHVLLRERYEETWKMFMEEISEAGANRIPYMVAVGNHESECHSPFCLSRRFTLAEQLRNFTAYNCRFSMNGARTHSMWHSFSLGPVFFVALNTETDFPGAKEEHHGDCALCHLPSGGFGAQGEYLAWVEETLANARKEFPWVVVYGHRPFFNVDGSSCADAALCQTQGEFMEKYADVVMTGHVHGWSRLRKKTKQTPVYIVNGGGGCDEWTTRTISGEVEVGVSEDFDWLTFGASPSMATLKASSQSLVIEGIKSETGEVFDRVELFKNDLNFQYM